jgi:hypothetical protein
MSTPPGALDWRAHHHWNSGRRLPCRYCGRPAFLRDEQGIAAHKVCAEQAATSTNAPTRWELSA